MSYLWSPNIKEGGEHEEDGFAAGGKEDEISGSFETWYEKKLTQEEAAVVLGICSRTFRRHINRYEEEGLDGLKDKRLSQASYRRAPVDKVVALTERYKNRYRGWNVTFTVGMSVRAANKKKEKKETRLQSSGKALRAAHALPFLLNQKTDNSIC